MIDSSKIVMFLYGVHSLNKDMGPDGVVSIQARLAIGNKEIKKIVVEGIGGLRTGALTTVTGNRGVKGVKNIIDLRFSDDYCGGAFGDIIYFWTGTDLFHVKTLYDGADAPVYSSEELIFPADEGGKPGVIIFKYEDGEWDEVQEKDIVNESRTEYYFWNGSQLVKK
jgi:hypothetical protein